MRRSRVTIAALAAGLVLTAGCSFGNIGGTSGSSDTTPTAAPSGSVLIQDVQKDWTDNGKTIAPKAIVLHWWAGWGGGHDINRLIKDANNNATNYDPTKNSKPTPPTIGHVTVQVGVLGDGRAYQLTPQLNTLAHHAKCANWWAIGIEIEGFGPGHSHYIGDDKKQFDSVVQVVKYLMAAYHIPAVSVVADDGKSGQGIVSHKMVDAHCQWADGKPAGEGKDDVDDAYLKRVLTAVGG